MTRNPIVLFAGQFWAGASEAGLADGFRDLGWVVQEVDLRDLGLGPAKMPLSRVATRFERPLARRALDAKLIEIALQMKPDVFLTVKGVDVSGEFLRRVKGKGVKTIMYYPDYHFDHPGVCIDSFREYDLFITTKTFQLAYLRDWLGHCRVAYVPHGYSDNVHRPVFSDMVEADYQCDILYGGNHSVYKQRWIEPAISIGKSVHIVGNRWQENLSRSAASQCVILGERTGAAFASAIQTARINIAVHMGPDDKGWQDRVSTRTFEIPACRGFMLHIDSDELREFFEPEKEIAVFSSAEELADKINFYLAHTDLRMQMIERAWKRCVPAYSYGARAKQIVELLKTLS